MANFEAKETRQAGIRIPKAAWQEMDLSPVGPYLLKDILGKGQKVEFKAENAMRPGGFQLELPPWSAFVFEIEGL